MAEKHNINLFFYIKGSKDYPNGLTVGDKFGFDDATYDELKFNDGTYRNGSLNVSAENAVFENSIRDLFVKNKNLTEISNVYSLLASDDRNKILKSKTPSEGDTDFTGTTTRTDRSMEYISTMLIKQASSSDPIQDQLDNDMYKTIFPNYDYSIVNEMLAVEKAETYDTPPRQAIFWQKMFTLFEFLKKVEVDILDNAITGSYPSLYNTNADTWWAASVKEALDKETSLGQFLGLFIGSDNFAPKDEVTNHNRFRLTYVTGTDVVGEGVNLTQEKLWKTLSDSIGLDIKYIAKSATFQRSQHENRVGSMSFSVEYKEYSNTDPIVYNFTLCFDPDTFMESTSSSEYAVWTYNDRDMDERYPDYKESGFNIYDNDYANMLRDLDDPNRGHFIASNEEVQKQFAEAMLDIMNGGDYTGFVEFKTRRISPEIVQNGNVGTKPKYEVSWDNPDAVTDQTFYVYYNTIPPTIEQQKTAVRNYLLNLHSHCHEQTNYGASEAKVGVKYIGHPTSRTELINWLSNMYPEMFSETVVYVIPPHITHRKHVADDEYKFKPEDFFTTSNPKRIYESMRAIYDFRTFELSTDGSVTIPATSGSGTDRKQYPTETFYIGGRSDNSLNNGYFKFGFPWIASTNNTDATLNPLTSQTGFADYVPKYFSEDIQPSTPADEFQLIMIYLATQMFIQSNVKHKIVSVNGITITYEADSRTDSSIDTINGLNVAKFVINSVTFKVYAQFGKIFCTADSLEVSY